MTPMTKNENLIQFKNAVYYVIMLLHYHVITLLVITLLCEEQKLKKEGENKKTI